MTLDTWLIYPTEMEVLHIAAIASRNGGRRDMKDHVDGSVLYKAARTYGIQLKKS